MATIWTQHINFSVAWSKVALGVFSILYVLLGVATNEWQWPAHFSDDILNAGEAILMSTHNVCFCGEISKIIPNLSK